MNNNEWKQILHLRCGWIDCGNCCGYKMYCVEYTPDEKIYQCEECYGLETNPDEKDVFFDFLALRILLVERPSRGNKSQMLRYLIEKYCDNADTYNLNELHTDLKKVYANYKDYKLYQILIKGQGRC